ncbi:MAG: hypothetical protein U0930_18070 [Pirellulales bacterium]
MAPVRCSPVSAKGKIHPEVDPQFYPHSNLKPAYWLKTQLVDSKSASPILVRDETGAEIGQIEVDQILDDDMLR